MNKKNLVIASVAFALIALGSVAALLLLPAGPQPAAEAFLARLARGEVDAGYRDTGTEFQGGTSLTQFRRIVRRTGLDAFASVTWSQKEVKDGQALLSGEMRTSSGQTVPLLMQLGREGDAWRVLGFEVTSVKSVPDPPPDREVTELIEKVMNGFVDAIQAHDFGAFHKTVARSWQAQVTPQQFSESFAGFYNDQLDLAPLSAMTPSLDTRPQVGSDTILTLSGTYPTNPSNVHFNMRFVDQDGEWKLVGLKVELVQPPSAGEPAQAPAPAPEKPEKKGHRGSGKRGTVPL